jgi:hypothetical protein
VAVGVWGSYNRWNKGGTKMDDTCRFCARTHLEGVLPSRRCEGCGRNMPEDRGGVDVFRPVPRRNAMVLFRVFVQYVGYRYFDTRAEAEKQEDNFATGPIEVEEVGLAQVVEELYR